MRTKMIGLVVGLGLVGACLFDGGQDTRGLPCEQDRHCGEDIACIQGVCGGPGGGITPGDETTSGGDDVTPECSVSELPVCTGNDSLEVCDGERWVVVSCSDECAATGLQRSWGCFDAAVGGTCVCDPESTVCSPVDTAQCYDGVNTRVCLEDGWAAVDCDLVCDAIGGGSGPGCASSVDGLTCNCTDVCEEGAMFCESGTTLRSCEGGSYVAYDCSLAQCEEGQIPIGCGYFDGGDTCLCL